MHSLPTALYHHPEGGEPCVEIINSIPGVENILAKHAKDQGSRD